MPVLTRRQAQVLRPQYDLTNGLVGWWPLTDGRGQDVSGFNRNGSVVGGATTTGGPVRDPAGRNGALNITSASQYVTCGNVLGFDNTDKLSFFTWFKTSATAANCTIVSKQEGSGNFTGWFFLQGNTGTPARLSAGWYKGGGGYHNVGYPSFYNDGIWRHIGFTFNGNGANNGFTLYVNGVSVAATDLNNTGTFSVTNSADFQINGRGGTGNALSSFAASDLRVYNRALSPGEVNALYASAFQPIYVEALPLLSPGLYSAIDGPTPDDTDYIKAPTLISGATATYECALAPIANPGVTNDHVIQYRIRATGGAKTDCIVKLMCGTTEIASWTHVAVGKQFMTARQVLTSAQAASITNYSDLRLRFTSAPE